MISLIMLIGLLLFLVWRRQGLNLTKGLRTA